VRGTQSWSPDRRHFSFTKEQIEQGAETIKQQHCAYIYLEQHGDQHGGAKHGKQVLKTQGDALQESRTFFYLYDAFCCHGWFLRKGVM